MQSTRVLLLALFILFTGEATSAKEEISNYSDTAVNHKKASGEEEKQAIANAMNRYLDVVGITLGDLSLSNTDDGGKEASGTVSFFGFDQPEGSHDFRQKNKIYKY